MEPRVAPTNEWTSASERGYLDGLAEASRGLSGPDLRSFRSYGLRFLAYCKGSDVDPLKPPRDDWRSFCDALTPQQRWKAAHAVRRVLAHAGASVAGSPVGLGTTAARTQGCEPRIQRVIDETLESAGRRRTVWRAAIGRLLTFCDEQGWSASDLAAPDLDDYFRWLDLVGRSTGEQRQVARAFVALKDGLAAGSSRV